MRLIIPAVVAGAGLLLCGCFGADRGHSEERQYRVGFERPVEQDTVDFAHLQFNQYPLSVEIMGEVSLPLENSYTLMLQVGVYAAPGFDTAQLEISPDSLIVTAGGLRPAYQSPGQISWHQRPWAAMAFYVLVFNYDSLPARIGDDEYVHFEIKMPHHLVYGGHPVPVETVPALGTWITRPDHHAEE